MNPKLDLTVPVTSWSFLFFLLSVVDGSSITGVSEESLLAAAVLSVSSDKSPNLSSFMLDSELCDLVHSPTLSVSSSVLLLDDT